MANEPDLKQSKKDGTTWDNIFEWMEDMMMYGARIPVGFPTLLPGAEAYSAMSIGPTVSPGTYDLDPHKAFEQFSEDEKVNGYLRK